MKELKSGSIQSNLNQSHIVDDFTSDYYESISSKMYKNNGSEFKSSHKLKHTMSKNHMTPTKSVGRIGYGATVKRVKVDLISAKHRLGSFNKIIDDFSSVNNSNIIDDFESQIDGKEFEDDQPVKMYLRSPQHIHEHDLKNDLKMELVDLKKEMGTFHKSPINSSFNLNLMT